MGASINPELRSARESTVSRVSPLSLTVLLGGLQSCSSPVCLSLPPLIERLGTCKLSHACDVVQGLILPADKKPVYALKTMYERWLSIDIFLYVHSESRPSMHASPVYSVSYTTRETTHWLAHWYVLV